MKLLRFIPIVVVAVLLFGCNETYDPFEDDNLAPKIFTRSPYKTDYTIFTVDSVKVGHSYDLTLDFEDEGRVEVSTQCTNPDWTTSYDGETFSVSPDGPGETDIIVHAKDIYGVEVNATIHLTCFDNLPPLAEASCDVIAILAPYERMINATHSCDPDEKYGGGIEAYEFTIGGIQTAINDDGVLYHIFQGPGQYRIKVRVRDNDGVWSEEFYFDTVI